MSGPGHRPLSSREAGKRAPRAVRQIQGEIQKDIHESARLTRTDRVTLPYYKPPAPARWRTPEATMLEGFPADGPMVAETALRDVAVASFGESMQLEAVLGNDDRVRLADGLQGANPWRQICALRILSQTGSTYVGTGWFIAPRVLATAGHCVFLQKEGGWAKSIKVIPGKHGPQEPFGSVASSNFRAVDGWVIEQSRDFDYGVILLDDASLGTSVGNFGVEALDDGELVGHQAKISGYPADRERAEFQFFHERPIESITSTRLSYPIDTFGGQSGSPIWQDTAEAGVIAVGIHTTGGISSNSGTRIGAGVLDNLLRWIGE